jgi:hypothetical protein
VSVRQQGTGPVADGTRVEITRRVWRRDMTMTVELTDLNSPRSWSIRGVDGPVRGMVKGTIDPLGEGAATRVTMVLEFEGHGLGKVLVPLLVRRQASREMPKNLQKLSNSSRVVHSKRSGERGYCRGAPSRRCRVRRLGVT